MSIGLDCLVTPIRVPSMGPVLLEQDESNTSDSVLSETMIVDTSRDDDQYVSIISSHVARCRQLIKDNKAVIVQVRSRKGEAA